MRVCLGLPPRAKFCKNGLLGYTTFGQIYTKNLQFWRFYACKPTFLKPQPWTLAWGYGPETPSPHLILQMSPKRICPLANFYQKSESFAILSYLSPHLYIHNVKILHNRTDFGIHQQHQISSKSLKGPASIALPRKWCILISSSFLHSLFIHNNL